MLKFLRNKLMHFFFFLAILAGFAALGYYSYEQKHPVGYSQEDVQSLNELIERETAKPVSALAIRQARAYAEVYGITDAAKPVMIFGAKAR